jgi:hypothetical protein
MTNKYPIVYKGGSAGGLDPCTRIDAQLTSVLADLDRLGLALNAARLHHTLDALHAEWTKNISRVQALVVSSPVVPILE